VLTIRSAVVVRIVAFTEHPKWFHVCQPGAATLNQQEPVWQSDSQRARLEVTQARTLNPIMGLLATPLVAAAPRSPVQATASRSIVRDPLGWWGAMWLHAAARTSAARTQLAGGARGRIFPSSLPHIHAQSFSRHST
jgi:hypothetical protein